MTKFIISIVLQALCVLFLFPYINTDFKIKGDGENNYIINSVVVVLVFIALNFIMRKLLVIFTLGIGYLVYYLSLGIAGLIVNAIVLIIVGKIFPDRINVPTFMAAFWGGSLLALVNYMAE